MDEVDDLLHVVRVYLGGGELGCRVGGQLGGQLVALGLGPAGDAQLARRCGN